MLILRSIPFGKQNNILVFHSSYSSADFALPGIWQNLVWNSLSLGLLYYIPKYCGIFPILGISLWLTDFPKSVHTAEGGEDYAN